MLMFTKKKNFDIVDYTKNEMKWFTENDDVINAVSALGSNSPFFLPTEMLITGGKILAATSVGSGAP